MTAANTILDVRRDPPQWSSFSKPYWDATCAKKLVLQYDPQNQRYQHFPRTCGIATANDTLEWREVSGRGEIFTFTVARRARDRFAGHEPFLIVLVTLDEGVNVMANLINCDIERVAIGLRVKPCWVPLSNGTHLLMFEPDE